MPKIIEKTASLMQNICPVILRILSGADDAIAVYWQVLKDHNWQCCLVRDGITLSPLSVIAGLANFEFM